MYNEDEIETLTFEDIDILESIGLDLCESIRDLIYNIKEIKKDIDNIKKICSSFMVKLFYGNNF